MNDKQFLVGVDFDGTVFDSMRLKHSGAFIPTMIRVWKLEAYRQQVRQVCEEINLYSKTRGINRFPGLSIAFDRLRVQGVPVPEDAALKDFLQQGQGYSNQCLCAYMKTRSDPFLQELLYWSQESDRIFAERMKALEPFSSVKAALSELSPYAELVLISSASKALMEQDLKRVGLDTLFTEVLGQENGSKTEQLKKCMASKYTSEQLLMIGDAMGDCQAVREAGGRFYPIMPGKEEDSWQRFIKEGIPMLLSGSYSALEKEVLQDFLRLLS